MAGAHACGCGGRLSGRDAIVAFHQTTVRAVPDVVPQLDLVSSDGATVLVRGAHARQLPSAQIVAFRHLWTTRAGKIVAMREHFDLMTYERMQASS